MANRRTTGLRVVAALAAIGLGIAVYLFATHEHVPPNIELVLQDATNLTVKTATGTITIRAGSGLARRYSWNGCSLNASMQARPSRWFGSLGMYDPAGSFFILSSLFPHGPAVRAFRGPWWKKANCICAMKALPRIG
jgi:hypothetical protein